MLTKQGGFPGFAGGGEEAYFVPVVTLTGRINAAELVTRMVCTAI
ncbi:hypothetical protein [Phocaeicola barnesiae]